MPTAEPRVSIGSFLLGAGLAITALLGPFALDVFDYLVSDTPINETIGLDALSLLLVAP